MGWPQDRRRTVQTVAVPRRRLAPAVVVACATLLLVGAAACSSDGRTLAPIQPGQTTTTRAPVTAISGAPLVFSLSSPDVADGGVLPDRFTCSGAGLSPSLKWAATPTAEELALVVRDRNANGFVHWIVTHIDRTIISFGSAAVPESAVQQVNSTGALGWLAPCPPAGSGRHIYDFVLHVLNAPIKVDPSMPAVDVASRIEAASIAQARMSVSVSPGSAEPPGGSLTPSSVTPTP